MSIANIANVTPHELADALVEEILPDRAVLRRLLTAGEYAAVVLDTIEHAATHGKTVRAELLNLVQAAVDDGTFDEVDTQSLTDDLAVLRPLSATY